MQTVKNSDVAVPWKCNVAVAGMLLLHSLLLAHIGLWNSPNPDEMAHLPAGVYCWTFWRSDLYRVNPPLVRCVAACPTMLFGASTDWSKYSERPGVRAEWAIARAFAEANGSRTFWLITLGRWACVGFSVLGAWGCYRWASDLYGTVPGMLALGMWCFSPNILAWGATILPDAPAAALGLWACYFFWRWLRAPDWRWALFAGVTLGLAELTKTTWIVLFALWPAIWSLWAWRLRRSAGRISVLSQTRQLLSILLLGVYVLNLGYGFEGTFKRLDEFTFVSRSFSSNESSSRVRSGGNRFKDTPLGAIPMILPESYISGIDLQKADFERPMDAYLFGHTKAGGWWYYYLVCGTLKIPIGSWLLGLLAVWYTVRKMSRQSGRNKPQRTSHWPGWLDEFTLLVVPVVLIVLVSSQTGINRFFRYALPAAPFAFVWIGKTAQTQTKGNRLGTMACAILVTWMVTSSLWIYPHSMSYFNEFGGGPCRGHAYLVDANIDWAQDMWYLKRWQHANPEAQPIYLAYRGMVKPDRYDIEWLPAPKCDVRRTSRPNRGSGLHSPEGRHEPMQFSAERARRLGPHPGWHAISVHRLRTEKRGGYVFYEHLEPIARAGYSINIYRITLGDANRLRRTLGLPELPED